MQSAEVSDIFVPFLKTFECSQKIFIQVSSINFTEILPVEASLIHAHRLMEMKKLIGTFSDYANVPKMTHSPKGSGSYLAQSPYFA
jgi:hypothetical protein